MGRISTKDRELFPAVSGIIVDAVRRGEPLRDMARLFGVPYFTAYSFCRDAGIKKYTKLIHEIVTKDNLRSFVVVTDRGCWEWPGRRNDKGYAQIGSVSGYRHAFELFHGEIPNGLHVCHRCDNPPCVNPDHLFLGTHVDNMKDCTAKGRRAKGESSGAAKLTEDEVVQIRKMRFNGGFTLKEIGARFRITHEAVRQICAGNTWKHVVVEDVA